jgi:hypothetical protein
MLIYCCLCSVSLLSLYKFNFRYGLTWIEKYKSTNLYLHGCVVCVLAYSQISIWMDVTPSCSNICFGKGPHACACLYVCIWVTMCRVLCWKTLTIWRCLLLVDILNYCCFSSGAVLLHSSEKIKISESFIKHVILVLEIYFSLVIDLLFFLLVKQSTVDKGKVGCFWKQLITDC